MKIGISPFAATVGFGSLLFYALIAGMLIAGGIASVGLLVGAFLALFPAPAAAVIFVFVVVVSLVLKRRR